MSEQAVTGAAPKVHEGCDDKYCHRCRVANDWVNDRIYAALPSHWYDRLGQYHSWLKKNGIEPETDGGWWSAAALDVANIDRFIEAHTAAEDES